MKVLVTGADGFIGKNLCVSLALLSGMEITRYTRDSSKKMLPTLVGESDFIFHIAGINRPKHESEFFDGNADLTMSLCKAVESAGRVIPVLMTSSIQAEMVNPYGRSKLQAEMHLLNLYLKTNNPVYICRLPNVFGKWCRPNYNSVVATFCHNISHDIPITINNPDVELNLVHIDDVVTEFIRVMMEQPQEKLHVDISPVYQTTVGELASQLKKFRDSRETLVTEAVGNGFLRVLYATYISYISPDNFNYSIEKHEDNRGIFVEMLKTKDSGQFSFFTARPGVTRGGHYHHVKNEKFLVIKGKARFGFRHIITNEKFEIITSGDAPEIVETVPGWSHDITNIGDEEMFVILWANENFNPEKPDTVSFPVM